MTTTLTRNELRALLDLVADFAQREVAPRVADYDHEEQLPRDLLDQAAELGLFGGTIPVELGGLGLSHVVFAQIVEEMSKVCTVMGCLISMPSGLVGSAIRRFGTPEQQQRWLLPLAQGKIFGAAGVTEPASGSDVAGMATTYRTDGDSYVINGAKAWISNLDIAEFIVTFATRDRSLRHRGISAFVIPIETPGLQLTPYRDKLGFRPLCTGEVVLDDVRIPKSALLGVEGKGFGVAMTAVEFGRLGVAARAVGLTQAVLDDTRRYAMERIAFGKRIGEFQLTQSKIADMAVGLETSRALVRGCAEALDAGRRARTLTSMAKMYATDVAFRSASDSVQVHGAYGVSPEYRVGRFLRDATVLQIVEGSNSLHRALIGEMVLGLRNDGEARIEDVATA